MDANNQNSVICQTLLKNELFRDIAWSVFLQFMSVQRWVCGIARGRYFLPVVKPATMGRWSEPVPQLGMVGI